MQSHMAARLEEGGGEIDADTQALREKERLKRLEIAYTDAPGAQKMSRGQRNTQLFAAIRAANKDRARELLQTGADANASEPAPWWIMAGTLFMPCILCCAFSSPKHYSRQALHVAMIYGDTEMVKLLLESNADPKAPAVFWNCCCCSWRAQSASFQAALMGNPDTGSANSENGDPVPPLVQAEIKRLVQG